MIELNQTKPLQEMDSDAKSLIQDKSFFNEKLRKKSINTRLLVIPILLSIIVFTSKIVYIALNFGADFGSKNGTMFNTFCQDLDKQNNPKDSLDYQVCHHSLKTRKFLWLNIDGLSFDQAQVFSKELKDDLLFFKSIGTTYRQSGAMHESHLTGRISTNYNAHPISNDNLINQFRDSKQQIPFMFTGEYFPLFTLIGSYFQKFLIRYRSANGFFNDMCDNESQSNFFNLRELTQDIIEKGDELNPNEFLDYLEERFPSYEESNKKFSKEMFQCLSNGRHIDSSQQYINESTIYYTAIFDRLNHFSSKKHTKTRFHIHMLNKFLIQLLRFYSNNFPDVAVIISSDHGGQEFNGEDSFCNHGCLTESNQAIFAISHPNLKGKGYSGEISYIDIAPTIAQVLEGVNVPIQSQGKVASLQKGEFKWEILAQYLRYVQIKKFIELNDEFSKLENKDQLYKDCLNLSSQYQDILALDEQQNLSQDKKQEILLEFQQCVEVMNKEKNSIEFNMIDLTLIHIFELTIFILISYIIIANYSKIKAAYEEYSTLNKIVFALAILMLFSDNLMIEIMKDNENTFFKANQKLYFALLIILSGVFCFKSTSLTTSLNSLVKQLQNISSKNQGQSSQFSGFFERRLSIFHCFIFYIGNYFLCQYFIDNDTILSVKQQELKEKEKNQLLTYFNYIVFLGLYFFPKFQKLQIHWIQKMFYIGLFIKMLMYDLEDLRFLSNKTFEQRMNVIILSISIGLFFIFNNLRAYSLFLENKQQKRNESSKDVANIFFTSTLIDLTIFVFFIADDIERLFLIILYLPVITITRRLLEILKLIHKTRTTSLDKEKSLKKFIRAVLVLAILFQCIHRTYLAFKGTLSLDINIKSGNKTIGTYQEEFIVYTGLIFGINKVTIPVFCFLDISEVLLSIDPDTKRLQISQISLGVMGIMFIKQLVSDFQLLINMFSGSMFFGLFIWAAITGVFQVQIVPYSIFCFVDYIQFGFSSLNKCVRRITHKNQKQSLQKNFEI